jgi:hypothetical protein
MFSGKGIALAGSIASRHGRLMRLFSRYGKPMRPHPVSGPLFRCERFHVPSFPFFFSVLACQIQSDAATLTKKIEQSAAREWTRAKHFATAGPPVTAASSYRIDQSNGGGSFGERNGFAFRFHGGFPRLQFLRAPHGKHGRMDF